MVIIENAKNIFIRFEFYILYLDSLSLSPLPLSVCQSLKTSKNIFDEQSKGGGTQSDRGTKRIERINL